MFYITCFCLILIALFSFICFAHPGNTDENGGHYNQSTGDYHYHHGKPAHSHPGGVCLYEEREKLILEKIQKPTKQNNFFNRFFDSLFAPSLIYFVFSGLIVWVYAICPVFDGYLEEKIIKGIKLIFKLYIFVLIGFCAMFFIIIPTVAKISANFAFLITPFKVIETSFFWLFWGFWIFLVIKEYLNRKK